MSDLDLLLMLLTSPIGLMALYLPSFRTDLCRTPPNFESAAIGYLAHNTLHAPEFLSIRFCPHTIRALET